MNFNATLIGQMVTFAVFVWFCMKFVWPPLVNAMAERQKQIADGLAAADRAGRDLELAQQKASQQLREAKEQAAVIIEAANKRANQIIDEAKDSARVEGERILAAASADVEQATVRAKEELRGQVAALAVAGAERILKATVDANAHKAMLDKLAAEL